MKLFVLNPLGRVVLRRLSLGLLTLLVVSIVVFAATQWLPGDAAKAIAGRNPSPERLQALRAQLHLDRSLWEQYGSWLWGFIHADFGTSLANGRPVVDLLMPRIQNSSVLLMLVVGIAVPISLVIGIVAAIMSDRKFDTATSIVALTIAAIPEFVIALGLVMLFSTVVLHWFPSVSIVRPGTSIFARPMQLVLPVATLTLAVFPYLFRMTRGLTIEILRSDYIEMARLKGLSPWRVVLVHALPNAVGPIGQSVALVCAYLAGGIVVVEYVFAFPGIGQVLVNSVSSRDLPSIQAAVLVLAGFYVAVNILADVFAVMMTPGAKFAE